VRRLALNASASEPPAKGGRKTQRRHLAHQYLWRQTARGWRVSSMVCRILWLFWWRVIWNNSDIHSRRTQQRAEHGAADARISNYRYRFRTAAESRAMCWWRRTSRPSLTRLVLAHGYLASCRLLLSRYGGRRWHDQFRTGYQFALGALSRRTTACVRGAKV